MNLHSYSSSIPPRAAAALAEFEKEFTYPLGSAGRFRISHGDEYLAFFQSLGEATLLVVGNDRGVNGSIVRVKKGMALHREAVLAHYLCDLKVRADCRGTRVLPRLIRETKHQIETSDTQACYCVVMGGSGRLPTDYTGRLGVPKFEHLADITILRMAAGGIGNSPRRCRSAAAAEFFEVRKSIGLTGYHATATDDGCRSLMKPVYLITGNGDACGIIGDTRRAKRLILDSGEELVSAHLSGIRYKTADAAGLLFADAVELARYAGLPAVFTAVPSREMSDLRPRLAGLEVMEAPAMIYGVGMGRGVDWWIDTAEI